MLHFLYLLYKANELNQNAYEIAIGHASFVFHEGFYYRVGNQAISNDRSVRIYYIGHVC